MHVFMVAVSFDLRIQRIQIPPKMIQIGTHVPKIVSAEGGKENESR